MAKYIKGEYGMPAHRHFSYGTDFYNANLNGGVYLTQKDYAVEFGLLSAYQLYVKYVHANNIEDACNMNSSFINRF